MNVLEMLPIKRIKARDVTTKQMVDVLIDGDYDGEYLSAFKWYVMPGGYVYNNIYSRAKTKAQYLHHLVLPPKKGYWIHFKNGNKLDVRSANLEYITPSESAAIRKQGIRPKGRGHSAYRGVAKLTTTYKGKPWTSPTRWVATCRAKYVGCFPSAEEAAKAYDVKAKETWGNRAVLNFPEEQND